MEERLGNVQGKQGFSAEALKTIAIIAMLIDHVALLLSNGPLAHSMHFIGRITGPLMFFFIAEGYRHTRNINRYTQRLAIFALISYFPYVLFVNNGLPTSVYGWLKFNVIYTLLLGLLALRARHEVKKPLVSICLVGVCLLASVFGDWSFMGVIVILLFDLLRGDLTKQRIGFCLVVLLFDVIPPIAEILTGAVKENPQSYLLYSGISIGMLLPMILLGRYNGQRGRGSKWLFYVFYPAHLLLLFFVAQWLGITIKV